MGEESEPETRLPNGLDLLWGRRQRGQRGPKPGLDLDAIVSAAVAVADDEGLEAVSMARVAKELGFTPMSLYRYVDSKEELLQLMWNASAAGAPEITGDDWRSRLESWAQAQHEMLARRTWVLQMPMVNPPAGPNSLAWVEQAIGALEGTGLAEEEKFGVVGLLSTYTFSDARMTYDVRAAVQSGETRMDYAGLLRAVVDEETYPALYRAAHSGWIDGSGAEEEEASFRFGLERILDGVAVLVNARAESSAGPAPNA